MIEYVDEGVIVMSVPLIVQVLKNTVGLSGRFTAGASLLVALVMTALSAAAAGVELGWQPAAVVVLKGIALGLSASGLASGVKSEAGRLGRSDDGYDFGAP